MLTRRFVALGSRSVTQVRFASSGSTKFNVTELKTHKCEGAPTTITIPNEDLVKAFKDMVTIRNIETNSKKAYMTKKIQGFLHLYDGQESIATGIEGALKKDDAIITAYREHGWAYTRGSTPREIFGELFGKVTGTSKGNGGSMHMYSFENNFYGGNGIVGAQCPIGAGIAFSQKYLKKPNVCVTLYGDGAANQGQLYEAFNMSYLWKLPVIYVCENNLYGMGTSVQRASASDQFYKRGDYVPGVQVQAMDYPTVRAATEYARNHALEKGPIVLEMITYRFTGHSMSDPGTTYRTQKELEDYKKRDPIDLLKGQIIENNVLSEAEVKEIEKQIRKEVDDARQQAEDDEFPPIEQTYENIYTHPIKVRGVEFNDVKAPQQ